MEHTGHRERIRERFREEGLDTFAPHEVLELILTFAIPRMDVNPLAHRLLEHFGSLPDVLEASEDALLEVDGIGPQSAMLLAMLLPLWRRYNKERLHPAARFATRSDLEEYCAALFMGAREEQMYVLSLDNRQRLLGCDLISSGTPSEVSVHPRLVVNCLMKRGAACAVLTHNHPSLSPLPSHADIELTQNIEALLAAMDIRLSDHIIAAGTHRFSFQREGLLQTEHGQSGSAAAENQSER